MQLDRVLGGTDGLTALDDALDAAWEATDPALLELCRNRVAMLLRHHPTLESMTAAEQRRLSAWPTEDFTPLERAALEYTEQYVIDVASLDDAQVTALREHLGAEGLVDFVNALLVLEQRMSLELVFDGLFGEAETMEAAT